MKDIRQLILDNADTMSGFAEKCSITRATLNNVLNNRYRPRLKTIKKICKTCNVNYMEYYKQ